MESGSRKGLRGFLIRACESSFLPNFLRVLCVGFPFLRAV